MDTGDVSRSCERKNWALMGFLRIVKLYVYTLDNGFVVDFIHHTWLHGYYLAIPRRYDLTLLGSGWYTCTWYSPNVQSRRDGRVGLIPVSKICTKPLFSYFCPCIVRTSTVVVVLLRGFKGARQRGGPFW